MRSALLNKLKHDAGALFILGLLLALSIGLSALYASRTFNETIEARQSQAQQYADRLEYQLSHTLRGIEGGLLSIDARPTANMHRQLATVAADWPYVSSVSLVGEDGVVIDSSDPRLLGVQLVLDDLVPDTRRSTRQLQIGRAWNGPGTRKEFTAGIRHLPLVMRLARSDGRLATFVALLAPDYFYQIQTKLLDSHNGSGTLLRADGRVLMSTARLTAVDSFAGHPPLIKALRNNASGLIDGMIIDGVPQLSALRHSSQFPLAIQVNLNGEIVAAAWRAELLRTLGLALPALLVMGILLFQGYRGRVREREEQARLRADAADQLASLVDALAAQVLMLDRRGYVVHANRQWCEFTGLPAPTNEHFTLALRQLNPRHLSRNSKAIADIEAVLAGSVALVEFDEEFATEQRHIWLNTVVRRMDEQTGMGVLIMQYDISARKQAEADRDQTNNLLRASLRELNVQKLALDEHAIVAITDANGKITYVNDKFVEVSGYSREEALGQTHRLVKSGMHSAAFYEDLMSTISSGKPWHGEIANRRKNGETYWVAATIVPRLDDNNLPIGYISVRTDITAQKLAEQALDDARKRELSTGYGIQRSLLHGQIPDALNFASIATYSEPSAYIDGDFYAFASYTPDCFELLVGDVMGKGINAALVGAGVKNAFHSVRAGLLAAAGKPGELPPPEAIVNGLHAQLTPKLIELDTFVTLALYRFDRARQTVTLVNAGHTPAIVSRANGQIESVLGENLPLGVLPDERYRQSILPIAGGDMLVAYSDGMTETRNRAGIEFGDARLETLLARARAAGLPPAIIVQHIRRELRSFAGSPALADDQTMVVIDLHASANAPALDVPITQAALPALRAFVSEHTAHMPAAAADALLLATFEAATNVIRHVATPLDHGVLTCRITPAADATRVELFHLGEPFVPAREPRPDFSGQTSGGFGLYLIDHLLDQADYLAPLTGICCVLLYKRHLPLPITA